MIEIRFHGRGGQGAVTASNLMVIAMNIEDKYGQGFPMFAGERRGAPVTSFTRIDDKPVRVRQQIFKPDGVVVLDSGLITLIPWYSGLKEGGFAVLNWKYGLETVPNIPQKTKIGLVDATGISLKIFGERSMPITNTAMLGALAKTTGIVKLESLYEAIRENWHGSSRIVNVNIGMVETAYEHTEVIEPS